MVESQIQPIGAVIAMVDWLWFVEMSGMQTLWCGAVRWGNDGIDIYVAGILWLYLVCHWQKANMTFLHSFHLDNFRKILITLNLHPPSLGTDTQTDPWHCIVHSLFIYYTYL